MYIRNVGGTEYLCIYKKGKNAREDNYNIKNSVISNFIIAIIGGTGSGKTVFMNTLSNELNEHGYTVVYVTEKKGDEFSNAVCRFEPTEHYHLALLHQQGEDIITKPVKLYHHFSFNIPFKQKLPPVRWFTSSVRNLNDTKLNAIMPTESEMALDVCEEIAKSLSRQDNMYDYLWKVYLQTRDEIQQQLKYDVPDELYTPPEATAGKVTFKNIKQGLKVFKKDWFLHEDESPYQIDYVEMLNDNKHWHFLSTKWLSSKKAKLLSIIDFLMGIDEALQSGKVKNNVVINLEELKILIGSGDKSAQQGILMDILYDLLSRIRTKAYVIGTMQSIFDIDYKFRGLFNKLFLGRLNFNDLRTLIKDMGFRVDDQNKLNSLKVGEFVLWESDDEDEKVSDKILINVPTFANAEQGETFFTKYNKAFPHLRQNNRQFYNRMLKLRSDIEKKSKTRLKEFYEEQKQIKSKKKLKDSGKTDELKEVIKEEKAEKKDILMQQVYDMKTENPDMSFRAIARAVKGISTYNTAKKYYQIMLDKKSMIKNLPKLDK